MNRIIAKKIISEDVIKFEISTSIPINDIKPSQYIILRMKKNGDGFALSVVKTNAEKEIITVIVSVTDESTRQLANLNAGDTQFEIEGPFGYPAQIENFGTVLCIGRESGIVPLLPVLTALRVAGNQIISVLSAPLKDGIILQNEIKAISDEVITITDDGSSGEKRSICQVVGQTMRNNRINQVFIFGTAKSIKETCSHTIKNNIQTQAVLYMGKPIKNGVHGIFKVTNCGCPRSVCVDGFNFNAWYPNFEEMIKRFGEAELEIQGRVNILNEVNVPN